MRSSRLMTRIENRKKLVRAHNVVLALTDRNNQIGNFKLLVEAQEFELEQSIGEACNR